MTAYTDQVQERIDRLERMEPVWEEMCRELENLYAALSEDRWPYTIKRIKALLDKAAKASEVKV